MRFSFFLGLFLVFGRVSIAQRWTRQLDSQQQSSTPQSIEPCAQLANIVNPLRAANPKGPSPSVPGQLAFDCMNSVPLHKEEAMGVAGSLLPYVQFQSDLAYKKNPPAGYQMSPVDLIDSITRIVDNLTNNGYKNEYSWQADTFRVFNTAKDGHFRFIGDLLGKVVRFQRQTGIVSVSMDGVGLPQIYMLDDIKKTQGIGQSFKPSVVIKINDQEAVSFIEKEADLGFQQDTDAAYNTMFFSPATNFNPTTQPQYGFFGGDSRFSVIYPGPNTTMTFANGTSLMIPTVARVVGNLTGIVDGESLYQRFCNPARPGDGLLSTSSMSANPTSNMSAPKFTGLPSPDTARLRGYPVAKLVASDYQISGYYLNTSKDVGVLAIQSFSPSIPQEFQAVVQTMLAEMQRDGKNKLIVDLSTNGGGSILQGFDSFRQLFPLIQDQSMSRFRKQPALLELAQASIDLLPNPLDLSSATSDQIVLSENHYNFRFDVNIANQHFKSLPEKFEGPTFNGDNFTNLFQFDFNDPILTTNDTFGLGMEITGYGTRTNFTQPFPAENIVMLYDGQCASTCTLFSEMMRLQGGVKSIAMGGRPSTSQIQGIGGVKGSSDNTFDDLFSVTDFVNQNTKNTSSGANKFPTIAAITDLPKNRSIDNSINMQDHILPANFKDGIPAQYVNEPADCRIFYTPAMIVDISKMWEAAADAAFNGKACVVGGISAGMVKRERAVMEKRREMIRRAEMPQLRKAAEDARIFLAETRTRSLKRFKGWAGLHGRGVPFFEAF